MGQLAKPWLCRASIRFCAASAVDFTAHRRISAWLLGCRIRARRNPTTEYSARLNSPRKPNAPWSYWKGAVRS